MGLRSGTPAHRAFAVLLGASLLATVGAAAPGPARLEPAGPAGPTPFGTSTAGVATTVTLITGDRVHLLDGPGNRQAVTVDPAPRADGGVPPFRVTRRGEATYVVPADVATLIPARLDATLFDVTSLAAQGLDDASSPTLPLILDYPDDQLRTLSDEPVPGVRVRRELDSVGALAVDADRSPDTGLGRAIQRLAAPDGGTRPRSAGRLAGVDKIWLDARVEAQLDRSTGQISAPAAWQAGFDGSGVTAAVLDTGIDETHPDLAGKVEAAVNFTEDGDTVDRNGHGTHVASTIAGTGAASDGARRGVAPGARLLSGKVLDAGGFGFTSWVIAGMEWAAGQGADIVNMSLGLGPGHVEGPLVTSAIERLSAEHGTLFVVAAGNGGCTACIGSPGDAPSALTVGAVDRDDQLADFSSRGPVFDGHHLKPDITAPGVGIAAARADGTGGAGDPADPYIAYSGTSMATPHVAGAAALLAQAHPELTGPELKAALMSTAVATDGPTVYDQGAGRVDVGRLLASPVLASVGSVSFGLVPYPADGPAEPLRRAVSYRNVTTEPVTVQLGTEVAGVAGSELTVTPSQLTIGPGATASTEVVLDMAGGTPGQYGGHLVAETGDGAAPLRTPIGFFVQEQHFDLTLTAVARDGRPALASSIFASSPVIDVETGEVQFERCEEDPPGLDYCVRVAAGTYSVLAFVYTKPAWADSDGRNFPIRPLHTALVGDPELAVTADTTVRLDARRAVEVQVHTPDHDSHANPGAAAGMGWIRTAAHGITTADFLLNAPGDQLEERLFMQPTDQVSAGSFLATSRFRLSAPEIVFDAAGLALHPVYYRADLFSDHSWQYPMLEGKARMPVVDAGQARPGNLAGIDLDGALALVRRTDDIPVDEQSNRAADAGARMVAVYHDQPGSSGQAGERGSMLEVPTVRLSHAEGMALLERLGTGALSLTATGTPSSPYRYDLVHAYRGRIPADLTHVADTEDLAVVERDFDVQVEGTLTEASAAFQPGADFSVAQSYPVREAPAERTDYYLVDPDAVWRHLLTTPEDAYGGFWPEPFVTPLRLSSPDTRYDEPGTRQTSWLRQPLVPGFDTGRPMARRGDVLIIPTAGYVDAAGNFGEAVAAGFGGEGYDGLFQVWQGDELLGEASGTELPSGTIALPPGEETFRIDYSIENQTPWATLSTSSRTEWTFGSATTDPNQAAVVPLLTLDYDLGADLTNRLPGPRDRRGPSGVSVEVGHLAGADVPVAGVTVEASYDDGQTWQALRVRPVGDRFWAHLPGRPPRDHTGFLSLRVGAADSEGNRIDQEIIRAVALPAT